jgi:3-keto-L-gulonate-6-phosphate decarboxylase
MTLDQQIMAWALANTIENAINTATEYNLVITVELVPNTPLAMGNYHMKVEVRPARGNY